MAEAHVRASAHVTPNRPSKPPIFHSPCPQYFTASKQTPRTSSSFRHRSRPSFAPSSSRSRSKAAAAAKLKAFELQQSQSARKEQLKKEQSLKSLSKSLTVWLNFLFQNPKSCGCDLSINGRDDSNVVRVDSTWRSPKRMRELWWRGDESEENIAADISSSKYSILRSSLKEVCSFDDLKLRMRVYLSLGNCKEILNAMTQVVKNIDEGRLNMKAHCPIVTDVRMKENATKLLMSYNPIWLRIGLYIIFGGDSLLSSDGDNSSMQDISFLKMVIEKQFFSHPGLAKAYAYNKKVEGLYRPGYYENLGNVILKRILLLVLILDRAKSQTTLPLKYGIDGVDGGSPLLFTVSSGIKSSRQVLNDFLSSDVMHGEGNLLAHLVIVGYKVSHQQSALVEFDFQVSDLFLDFQDGVRLCRVIQLLRHDPSILMKIVVPSDTQKKNLANCGVALEYLKQAGVMLCDEDGLRITGDDVASGDKELTLSLLWNIFVHLQLPLLIDKTTIADEISKIGGFNMDSLNVINSTLMGILLNWIQAICGKYDLKIDSFSSLDNGKAIWCLLDYYFRRELSCSCSNKDSHEPRGEKSIMSATDYTDAVHNFILSQKLTTLLGNFPEDQLNFHKLLGCGCQSLERRHSLTRRQSASSDTVVHNKERDIDITKDAAKKFKAIQAWWQNMTEQNYKSSVRSATSISNCSTAQNYHGKSVHSEFKTLDMETILENLCIFLSIFLESKILRLTLQLLHDASENAATIIQSHYRRLKERRNFLKMMKAICLVQTVVRTWLTVKKNTKINKFCSASGQEFRSEELKRVATLIVERHNFINLRRSVLLTQQAAKIYIAQRRDASCLDPVKAAIVIQKYVRGWMVRSYHILGHACTENASLKCQVKGLNNSEIEAATRIQIAWKNFLHRSLHKRTYAATKIQSYYRGWRLRMRFMKQKQAITKIQSNFRRLKCWRAFQNAWKEFICRTLQNQTLAATRIQSHFRGWQFRRNFMKNKQAIIKIQSHFRGWQLRKNCMKKKKAIIKIQSNFRLQKCLRAFQQYKNANRSAIIIQSFVRGWMARREARRYRYLVVMIQSHWKGYVARKESRGQLKDLRLRMVESAKNVDDSKRIINRLLSALSVLLSMKSISGILHHCETLDMATAHSQKCCEELVAAGAIGILLKQIRSASRSIPDQQVLKHALSTLRNLARYPHLAEVLIDTPPSVEIILWEMLRNKEEGYFIASEILKKICSNPKGVKAVHKFPALLKRLHTLVEELTRKLNTEKRNPRTVVLKENTDRRLKEAVQLLRLITNGYRIQ
ncbi:abnormal spindle-like microcephaly-associated protein-like protein isoform X1 [Gossypium australe]|uniref:Abnormal spindle-like microcephaly-associated protein-like protein isoform X1 n=1 Tax=Gossypium australe TaxID=47621 RepID=A0A5B6W9X1_9ROSI|nr:abnormal spindle-like microcephaly-associated protein-like protein isoform X1 [Gossypium australe]